MHKHKLFVFILIMVSAVSWFIFKPEPSKAPPPTHLSENVDISVSRLARSVHQGDIIAEEDLQSKTISAIDAKKSRIALDIKPLEYQAGMLARHNLKSGDIITYKDVVLTNDPDYSNYSLSPDELSFELAINSTNLHGKQLKVGDRVGAVLISSEKANLQDFESQSSKTIPASSFDSLKITTLFSNIRVLNIKRKAQEAIKGKTKMLDFSSDSSLDTTVLQLAVPRIQLKPLLLASQVGLIHVVNPSDEIQNVSPVSIRDVIPQFQYKVKEIRGRR